MVTTTSSPELLEKLITSTNSDVCPLNACEVLKFISQNFVLSSDVGSEKPQNNGNSQKDNNINASMIDMLAVEIEIERRVKAVERRLRSVEQPGKTS